MNKGISNKWLFVIFLVLVAASIYPRVFDKATPKVEVTTSQEKTDEQVMDVDKIEISSVEGLVTLVHEEGVWLVDAKKVPDSDVEKLVMALHNLEFMGLVSINPQNQESYSVSDSTGVKVTLYSGDNIESYVVGKGGDVPGTFYIREADKDETHLVKGNVLSVLRTTKDSWRDKTILSIPSDQIREIEIQDLGTVVIDPASENWETTDGMFDPLRAYGFLNEDEVAEFESVKYPNSMRIAKTDDSVVELLYINKDGPFWVKYGEDYFKVSATNFLTVSSE